MKAITVNKNDSGQRLDKFLQKLFKSAMPDSLIYKYIRKKRVKVNGKKSDINYILQTGDLLELYINDEFFAGRGKKQISYVKPDFEIIYEDENIALIDKKKGTVVHADSKGSKNTLIEQFLSYLYQKGEYSPDKENSFTPSLCNRIDRNTGGIVIAAKNAEALRTMNHIIKNRMVKKTYLALCSGVFEQKKDALSGYLVKDSRQNKAYITSLPEKGAQKAITSYTVLKQGKTSALLEVELITGRSHQIRAHLASIGHPIVGDVKYGYGADSTQNYQALHSYRLEFLSGFENTALSYLIGKTFVSKSAGYLFNSTV